MSASQINDLINPARLRLGIKRAFTGDVHEILCELFGNSQRAGARNVQITADDRGFIYQDDGRGLRDKSDFEALLKLGESGWDQRVEDEQQPMGFGIHSLLAHDEVESVTFSSNLLSLTLDSKRWWTDLQYAAGWADNLMQICCFPAPGMNIGVKCSRSLTEQLVKALTDVWQIYRSPARGYHGLLNITVNDTVVDTSVQEDAMPNAPLIETTYQNNKLVIGLYGKEGYATQNGIWVNFYGQMIPGDHYSRFQAYLEVRRGRPVNPMSPSRRGLIKDEALNRLCDFIRDSLFEYFSRTPVEEMDPLALQQYYRDYPAQASKLPCFVAARRKRYESGDDMSKMNSLSAPQVLSYENPPLLLADFDDPNNWDVDNVDFTVGGADPQDFYQTDAWAGFDPSNDQGRSREEMSESYRESCEREIRNLIGNAVPKNFSWDDLLRFVPEGEQIIAVTPEYRSRRKHRPVSVALLLSNDEMVKLSLF